MDDYSRRVQGQRAALSADLKVFEKLAQLEQLLYEVGFIAGWRCTSAEVCGFSKKPDERKMRVLDVVKKLSGKKVPDDGDKLIMDVKRLVKERSPFVNVEAASPGSRLYSIVLDKMFTRYLFGADFQDVDEPGCSWQTAKHADFWSTLLKEKERGCFY